MVKAVKTVKLVRTAGRIGQKVKSFTSLYLFSLHTTVYSLSLI